MTSSSAGVTQAGSFLLILGAHADLCSFKPALDLGRPRGSRRSYELSRDGVH